MAEETSENWKDKSQDQSKEKSIDDLFQEIEQIASALEKDEIGLEESFPLYQKGMTLLKTCGEKIDRVEKQLIILDENGGEYDE